MTVCVAYGCKSRTERRIKGVTFHRFPRDVERRQQWILAVRRANWLPSKNSSLCSKHFAEELFDRSSKAQVRLKREAVPTIFEGFPLHVKQEIDSLKLKAELNTPYPLLVKQEPFKDIQAALFGGSYKNRILTVPGDLNILSAFSSNNGNSSDQNHVLMISDDTDIKTMLNNEDADDCEDNRAIIVSDGTNMQSGWCGNIGEHSFLNGVVTLLGDTNVGIESLNSYSLDSSYSNPLLLQNSEFCIKRIKELEEVMVKLQKKLKVLHQTSRRNRGKIIKLQKEASRLIKKNPPPPHSSQPVVHFIACDH